MSVSLPALDTGGLASGFGRTVPGTAEVACAATGVDRISIKGRFDESVATCVAPGTDAFSDWFGQAIALRQPGTDGERQNA